MNRPRVTVVSQGVQVSTGRSAEHPDEHLFFELRDLADGRDPQRAKLAGSDQSDAPQPFHGQWVKKCELAFARHYEQTVRLGDTTGHLGQEFRPGHAHRYAQTNPLQYLAAQS
jgi:hypothetical protein